MKKSLKIVMPHAVKTKNNYKGMPLFDGQKRPLKSKYSDNSMPLKLNFDYKGPKILTLPDK